MGYRFSFLFGSAWSPKDVQAKLGHYDVLGEQAASMIPNCTLVEFSDLGHSPQIQSPERFQSALLEWLKH